MKKVLVLSTLLILFLGTIALTVKAVDVAPFYDEPFTYPDGPLVGQGGWVAHSGAGNKPIQVGGGVITLTQGAGSGEDVNRSFPARSATDITYMGFDLMLPSGQTVAPDADGLYFAHFAVGDTTGFMARIFVMAPTGGGDFGMAVDANASTTPDAPWASDLVFDTTYRIVTSYNAATGEVKMWIDPANEASINVSDATGTTGTLIERAAFRQSNDYTGSQVIDNLLVGPTFLSVTDPPTVDGNMDVDEGYNLAALQDTDTEFGNNNDASADKANGSELDGAYIRVADGNLYIMLTGNLETNFNKLEIFLDTTAGGQNILRADNADVDFDGLNKMAGLQFDAGFEADYYLTVAAGNDPVETYVNFATLPTGGSGVGTFVGGGVGTTVMGSNGINVAINNSNIAGVIGGNGVTAQNVAAVTTGIEFKIPFTVIGNPSSNMKVMAFINGSGHDFASNQFLGGIGGGSNLGGFTLKAPTAVNLAGIAGNQFFGFGPTAVSLQNTSATSSNSTGFVAVLAVAALVGTSLWLRRRNNAAA